LTTIDEGPDTGQRDPPSMATVLPPAQAGTAPHHLWRPPVGVNRHAISRRPMIPRTGRIPSSNAPRRCRRQGVASHRSSAEPSSHVSARAFPLWSLVLVGSMEQLRARVGHLTYANLRRPGNRIAGVVTSQKCRWRSQYHLPPMTPTHDLRPRDRDCRAHASLLRINPCSVAHAGCSVMNW
jgi:hypothetical protein